MKNSNQIRTGRHCVFNLHIHLVFVTKYRKQIFIKKHLDCLEKIFINVCKKFESELITFNGDSDNVHLLVNYPTHIQPSKLVNSLKGVSSRLLKKQFSSIIKHYYKRKTLWAPSYFAASCGGAPISILKQYIENQKTGF